MSASQSDHLVIEFTDYRASRLTGQTHLLTQFPTAHVANEFATVFDIRAGILLAVLMLNARREHYHSLVVPTPLKKP
jgi:hypothetical protein